MPRTRLGDTATLCPWPGGSSRAGDENRTRVLTGVAKNTIVKLLADLGQACSEFQDITLCSLNSSVIECDEIWAFCYAKQKNAPEEHRGSFGYGDVWTWSAIDGDTKLVPSWLVGERTGFDACYFLTDLKSRLRNARVRLTTDGQQPYLDVIEPLFGADAVDFAMLHKINGREVPPVHADSPASTGIDIRVITGSPEPGRISTSYVERQNLTMRMGMRRFMRLTQGFSRKVENLAHAISLHYMHYNFARPHQTLSKNHGHKTTPAMAANVADHGWTVGEIAGLLD